MEGGTGWTGGPSDGTIFRLLLPPNITIQPESQTNIAGNTVTFGVTATSLTPITYQWQANRTNLVDGGDISGTTSSTLSIDNIDDSDAGNYSVNISNADGSSTSSIVTLTVIDLPIINSQPQLMVVISGHTVNFTVNAEGTQPLTYQWEFNGTNLLGATNTALVLPNAFPVNAGDYTVAITNSYGSITSNPALLTVLPLQITGPAVLANKQFQFSFDTASGVDYAVQYSTNLMEWHPFVTLGGIGLPLTLIDPNVVGSRQRFYRINLSPQ